MGAHACKGLLELHDLEDVALEHAEGRHELVEAERAIAMRVAFVEDLCVRLLVQLAAELAEHGPRVRLADASRGSAAAAAAVAKEELHRRRRGDGPTCTSRRRGATDRLRVGVRSAAMGDWESIGEWECMGDGGLADLPNLR